VIETTTRRDRRTSSRLDQLIGQTGTDPDQPWDPPPLPEPERWPLDDFEHPARSPDPHGEPPPPTTDLPATGDAPAGPPGGGPPNDRPRTVGAVADAVVGSTNPPVAAPAGRELTSGWTALPGAEPRWRRVLGGLAERWLPHRNSTPSRWRLPVLAAGAVLLGVAVAAGLALSGSDEATEVPPALPAAAVSEVRDTSTGSDPGGGGPIVVSVVGRVANPGLVTVREGARVADALEAAGGSTPGVPLGGLNLARRLTDGEQIYVGIPTPAGAEPPAGASAAGQPGARVDLNAASPSILDTLPGVGPVTAQRIIDWRTQHGRFASIEQLQEVEGIGPTRFSRLKDLVVAG
jgi:competence protein ComEA